MSFKAKGLRRMGRFVKWLDSREILQRLGITLVWRALEITSRFDRPVLSVSPLRHKAFEGRFPDAVQQNGAIGSTREAFQNCLVRSEDFFRDPNLAPV